MPPHIRHALLKNRRIFFDLLCPRDIFPIIFMFGGLAWLEIPLDIGSVMTVSVALGIAVDDTLHFLTFYRRGVSRGMDRKSGVVHAYRHCGRAMTQTTLACGIGLFVFVLSEFVPTSRFACMMSSMLFTAPTLAPNGITGN